MSSKQDRNTYVNKQDQINKQTHYIGIDEVGYSPLAGELVVAGVVLPDNIQMLIPELPIDSKLLSDEKTAILAEKIKEHALYISVHYTDPYFISTSNKADKLKQSLWFNTVKEIRRVFPSISVKIDGGEPIQNINNQTCLVGGDGIDCAISAASIVGKQWLNERMFEMHEKYPEYGFNQHKGYFTNAHVRAIQTHGVCEYHRSYAKKHLNRELKKEEISLPMQKILDYLNVSYATLNQTEKFASDWQTSFVNDQVKKFQNGTKPTEKTQYFIKSVYHQFNKKIKKANLTITAEDILVPNIRRIYAEITPILKNDLTCIPKEDHIFLKSIYTKMKNKQLVSWDEYTKIQECHATILSNKTA